MCMCMCSHDPSQVSPMLTSKQQEHSTGRCLWHALARAQTPSPATTLAHAAATLIPSKTTHPHKHTVPSPNTRQFISSSLSQSNATIPVHSSLVETSRLEISPCPLINVNVDANVTVTNKAKVFTANKNTFSFCSSSSSSSSLSVFKSFLLLLSQNCYFGQKLSKSPGKPTVNATATKNPNQLVWPRLNPCRATRDLRAGPKVHFLSKSKFFAQNTMQNVDIRRFHFGTARKSNHDP